MDETKDVTELAPNPQCKENENEEEVIKIALANSNLPYELWLKISEYIQPEGVKAFSLVCPATADIANTKQFWLHLYKQFCANGGHPAYITALPENLQPSVIEKLSISEIPHRVGQSLFYCYAPFKEHYENTYNVDFLVGQLHVSSRSINWGSHSTTYYTFIRKLAAGQPLYNDWESLAIENDKNTNGGENEGLYLLKMMTVNTNRVPTEEEVPKHKLDTSFRLEAIRKLSNKPNKSCYNTLELTFIDQVNKNKITIEQHNVCKWEVLPWWHAEFNRY